MAYSEKLLDHYENPRNVGSFGKDDGAVGTGMVGAPECGDVISGTGGLRKMRFVIKGSGKSGGGRVCSGDSALSSSL